MRLKEAMYEAQTALFDAIVDSGTMDEVDAYEFVQNYRTVTIQDYYIEAEKYKAI